MSQNLPLNDYSGGLSDYLFNAPVNTASVFDNWMLNPDRSIECRPGSDILDSANPKIPISQRVSKLYKLGSSLLAISGKGLYKDGTEIIGPTGNPALSLGSADSRISVARLGSEHFLTDTSYSWPVKLFVDGTDTIQLRSSGLPEISTEPTLINSHLEGKSYIYAVVYSYTFLAGTTTFKDVSRPIYTSTNNGPDFELDDEATTGEDRYIDLSSLPVLSNGTTHNWDEVSIKVEIYRTPSTDSKTFYKVAEVSNGTTTYRDDLKDSDLITKPMFYISQGMASNDPPPRAKYIAQSNNAIWYLNIKDANDETRGNRIRQSIQFDGDSCPYDWFTEVDSDITGGESINDRLVVFTSDKSYRIDGVLTESGGGSITPETIDDTVGCISHDSIVKTSRGLYFASEDGFYFTDGYNVKKISEAINETYRNIAARPEFIQGSYDSSRKRVYWTCSLSSTDADRIYIYEEKFGAFTTISGGDSFAPSAILFDDHLVRGDRRGYILKHSPDLYSDIQIDTTKAVSSWIEAAIICDWKSIALDAGVFDHYKYWTKMSLSGKPATNVDITVRSYNEGSTSYKELTPTNFRPQANWGDTTEWGEPIAWDKVEFLNKTRRFPRGGLRAKHRQIQITNAYVRIVGSVESEDSWVTINSSTKVATLLNPNDYTMFGGNEGYDLIINGKAYEIITSTTDSVKVLDPDGTLPSGEHPWEIRGFPKGQRPHIHTLVLYYSVLDNDGQFPLGGN